MNIWDALVGIGFIGVVVFWIVSIVKRGKNEKNNSGSGNIPDTSAVTSATADSVGKNRVNAFLDRVRQMLSGHRTKTDVEGNPKDSSGGDPENSG